MNACKHGWTDSCLCVCLCMCMFMWLVRVTCLQGGAVYIYEDGKGTFTNCNFTSNSAGVSLEEEHVDASEMSKCMTLRLCRSHIARLTICALQILTLFYTVRLSLVEQYS